MKGFRETTDSPVVTHQRQKNKKKRERSVQDLKPTSKSPACPLRSRHRLAPSAEPPVRHQRQRSHGGVSSSGTAQRGLLSVAAAPSRLHRTVTGLGKHARRERPWRCGYRRAPSPPPLPFLAPVLRRPVGIAEERGGRLGGVARRRAVAHGHRDCRQADLRQADAAALPEPPVDIRGAESKHRAEQHEADGEAGVDDGQARAARDLRVGAATAARRVRAIARVERIALDAAGRKVRQADAVDAVAGVVPARVGGGEVERRLEMAADASEVTGTRQTHHWLTTIGSARVPFLLQYMLTYTMRARG